jgi:hypothetical protein
LAATALSPKRESPGMLKALLVLLFFYVAGLAVQMPMGLIVSLISLPPEVRLAGAEDSAWGGTIESLTVAGRDIGSIEYSFRPGKLLLGKIEYTLVLDGEDSRIEARLNRSLWSGVAGLQAVHGEVDASVFGELLPPSIAPRGRILLALDSLELRVGDDVHVAGKVEWQNLEFVLNDEVSFGTVVLDARPENGGTLVEVTSRNGELLVSGKVSIEASGDFATQIEFRPGKGITPAGRSLLGLVGSVDAGGVLKHAGKLF